MVEILRRVLGDQLFVPDSTDKKDWKSPEALKHKFLIRTNVSGAVLQRDVGLHDQDMRA